jgi:hypothetical protein
MVSLLSLFVPRKGAAESEIEAAFNRAVEDAVDRRLEALGPKPPKDTRPKMSADERRALGAEFKARRAEFEKQHPANVAALAALDAERLRLNAEMDAKRERLASEGSAMRAEFGEFRDSVERRAWDARSPLVDELITQLRNEAAYLPVARFTPPAGDPRGSAHGGGMGEVLQYSGGSRGVLYPEVITNTESVHVRRDALRDLADQVEVRTRRCEYADDRELVTWYRAAYAALPQIEGIRETMSRHPVGRRFLHLVPSTSTPPAAA